MSTNTRKLAEVFEVLAEDRKATKAETAKAVEEAAAKHRTPRWIARRSAVLLVGGLTTVAGIVFFTRSDNVKVSIELTDVDLSDKSLSFFLDDKPISAEELSEWNGIEARRVRADGEARQGHREAIAHHRDRRA